ncbi:membrane protein [Streptomyces abikoensis]|nr:membrane protein [Streptomyces abikoensis]
MHDPMTAERTLPVAATALTATIAVYITLVAFGNVTDFGTNQEFVRHVLAMDTTFQDRDLMWRAVTDATLQNIAYVAIIVWETLAALVLLGATGLWVRGLRRGGVAAQGFAPARRATTLGLLMLMLLFGLGFIAIGGEWFAMWQSTKWNGLQAATRIFSLAGIVLLLIHLPSPQWRAERAG